MQACLYNTRAWALGEKEQKAAEADGPDWGGGGGVHLRSCIIWTAATSLQEVPIPHDIAEPKVSDLDIAVGVQQQVLWLQIPVDHHVAVAVLHARNDLLEELAGLILPEPAFLYNVVKKLSCLWPTSCSEYHKLQVAACRDTMRFGSVLPKY